jgi:hypothetical protein
MKTEMKGKTFTGVSGNQEGSSRPSVEVARAFAEYETSLGDGGSLKAIDYIRLMEALDDPDGEGAVEVHVQWSEECDSSPGQ